MKGAELKRTLLHKSKLTRAVNI